MGRVLIVSNRLPVTAKVGDGGQMVIEESAGGLATGMRGPHQRLDALWIGWPGDLPRLTREQRNDLNAKLADLRAAPVHLDRQEVRGFYEDMANGVLWPVFHYLLDQLPAYARGWETYRRVNEKFAEVVAELYRPGDLVWIHDYHLALAPAILRRHLPDARIGFFLHIPFPSSEVFGVLPWREETLEGLLGADLIGLHTPAYLRHFATSLQRVLGLDVDVDRVWHRGHQVKLGVFPMGIDARGWAELANEPEVLTAVEATRKEAGGRKVIVGIDRLDYTKGILGHLLAIERLLSASPSLRDKIRLVQLTVPSRERVEAYARLRRRVDEAVGRINGAYGTPSAMPIHHLHRSLSQKEVSALYRAADVMLVTPLRDGMNLVAKEFIASRTDGDGVLILSEFSGAASELGEALHVNPYDVDKVAARISEALNMPESARRSRMRALRSRVLRHDVYQWATAFLEALADATADRCPQQLRSSSAELKHLVGHLRRSQQLLLILDYDGTLVPFTGAPDEAVLEPELAELLRGLAAREGTRVHVVTGRSREFADRLLGQLPIGIHAEHGLWSRACPDDEWRMLRTVSAEWMSKVRPIMQHYESVTRGTFIEEKTASIAWHYRGAKADSAGGVDFGEFQAKELRLLLGSILSYAPVKVLAGSRNVEVRPLEIHKGMVVHQLLAQAGGPGMVVAMGDDLTDEDLFAALPEEGTSIHVGEGPSRAQYQISDPAAAREILQALLDK
jgi:trehalose 6-phosphate synthase/phosphatase